MATLAALPDERNVSLGAILSRAFGVMGDNPVVVFGISCLFGAVPPLLFNYFVRAQSLNGIANSPSMIVLGGVSGLIFLLFSMLAQGALVRATVAYAYGERVSFGDSVSVGLRKALPLIALSILMGLGWMIGFVLLFVPGVILVLMWSVATPALVTEDVGIIGAFGRSRALTKGARWKIFGLMLLMLVIAWILSAILGVLLITVGGGIGMAASLASGPLPIWYMGVSLITSTLTTALWSTILTSLYIGLRNWKDGPQADALADVFA